MRTDYQTWVIARFRNHFKYFRDEFSIQTLIKIFYVGYHSRAIEIEWRIQQSLEDSES